MSKRPQELDIEFIKALAELLRANDLTEIEVNRDYGDEDALTVRVARQVAAVATQAAPAPAPVAAAAAPAAPLPPPPAAAADPAEDPGVVPSPMVGTAYLQPEPETPAFVKVGDPVTEGQTDPDHRGDEDDEPDRRAARRPGQAHPRRRRPAGGVRRAALHPGMSAQPVGS